MILEHLWTVYSEYKFFNLETLPEHIKSTAAKVRFNPETTITTAGDYPKYIYFLESGIAQGLRLDSDGNSYYYFKLDNKNGTIGLLEILAQEHNYIATTVASTSVVAWRFDSAIIYNYIMSTPDVMRNCLYVISHDLYQRSGNDGLLYYRNGLDRVKFYLTSYYKTHNLNNNLVFLYADYHSIASNLGISIRTVGRSIHELKESGYVCSEKRKIVISYAQYQKMLIDTQF